MRTTVVTPAPAVTWPRGLVFNVVMPCGAARLMTRSERCSLVWCTGCRIFHAAESCEIRSL